MIQNSGKTRFGRISEDGLSRFWKRITDERAYPDRKWVVLMSTHTVHYALGPFQLGKLLTCDQFSSHSHSDRARKILTISVTRRPASCIKFEIVAQDPRMRLLRKN